MIHLVGKFLLFNRFTLNLRNIFKLLSQFPNTIEVHVVSRCGASFAIEIVSEQFEGKRLLERHRMVNAALQEELKQIHALSIKKALTPEQWKQQQEAENSQPAA